MLSIRPKKVGPAATMPFSTTVADDVITSVAGKTILVEPRGSPASVVAVSERGDTEVSLGPDFSFLKLDGIVERLGVEPTTGKRCASHTVTPEKEKCLILNSSRYEESGLEIFLDTPDTVPAYDSASDAPRPELAGVAALLDLDASSSYYESPTKPGKNRSPSSSTASPGMALSLDDSSTPEKIPPYCGLLVCSDEGGAPLSARQIQARIAQFLSFPVTATIGGGWQRAWESGGEGNEHDNSHSSGKKSDCSGVYHNDSEAEKLELQRRLQRALVHRIHTKQSMHMKKLRHSLQPFPIRATARSRDQRLSQRRVHSFQDNGARPSAHRLVGSSAKPSSHSNHGASSSGPARPDRGKLLADHVLPIWTCGMNCGTLTDDELSPVVKNRKRPDARGDVSIRVPTRFEPDEEDCYDSDPETFCVRKLHFHDDKENIPPNLATDSQRKSAIEQSKFKEPSSELVQEMFNERFTLVVHQHTPSTVKTSMSTQATGVHAFLERGQQLKNRVLPPRLVWKPIHDEHRTSPSMSSLTTSISLLDIVRILEAERVVSDGQKPLRHNLARTFHTFYVQTLDDSFFIEAENREERDRFVHGLKVVVARMGSFLLCGDDRLLDEFFVVHLPESTQMVGQEPCDYLLQDGDDHFGETI